MSRRNLLLDDDGILDVLNNSDFGGDSDEDENWMPPGERPDSSSDEEQKEDDRAPVVAAPAARNTWTRRMYRGKPMPSVTTTVEEFLFICASLNCALCTIDGSFFLKTLNKTRPGSDPCNPLYWYPRNIPEYCYYTETNEPISITKPIPLPVPVPLPPQPSYHPAFPSPTIQAMPLPGMLPSFPIPIIAPHMPLPFGVPLVSTNPMLPVAGVPYNAYQSLLPISQTYPRPPPYKVHHPSLPSRNPVPSAVYPVSVPNIPQSYPVSYPVFAAQPLPHNQVGMLPGLPGIVTRDGGINILPFSDAYSDLLEKHKQKTIRRRLQKFLREYGRRYWN